jgi:[ribosomal protein S18]-alanine N-acetyltransferase
VDGAAFIAIGDGKGKGKRRIKPVSSVVARNTAIRGMRDEDLDAVLEIEEQSFLSPWTRKLFEETLDSSITHGFVLSKDDVVLGYVILYAVKDEAHIMNVAVHPSHRRIGFGKDLVAHVIDDFRGRDVRQFFLEVRESNAAAISLYRKYGFSRIGKRKKYYAETNEDAIVMCLSTEPKARH